MLDFTRSGNARYYIVACTVLAYVVAAPNCNSRFLTPQRSDQILKSRRNLQPGHPVDAPKVHRKRCCPYDFDSKFCRVVDDRVLCGYNKNVGEPISYNYFEQLSGGCRLRGDRLECGYEDPPYLEANPRRPPGWDNPPSGEEPRNSDTASILVDLESLKAPLNLHPNKHYQVQETRETRVTREPRASTGGPQRVTRCIETADNRIVCKHL